ncbi:TonB-dependent receptor plug domain-containing protein, partial [Geothrix limicola]|uniref:TonB-dependent receptor plug domain-containing protein n=1 Tax=Geothrix limicola TaxID=2927978 RepID=UPI002553259D
ILKVQQATVEVVSATTQVDKTETVTQTNMAIEEINQLMSSNLDAVTFLAPGIANPGGSPRIRGGSGNSTKFMLNGAMINDQAWGYDLVDTTIQDMIESVAVIQSPLNARYGNTDSGIVSFVTTKGSNTFGGSIRAKYYAGGMEATPVDYPNRLGEQSVPYPYADDSSRTYDVVFHGPIWKDHITFAFGGTYSPMHPTTTRMDQLIHEPALPTDAAGTYFKLPNGSVLRRANTYDQNVLEPVTSKSTFNQFVLYWQVNTNHQVEWNYTQNDYRGTWYGYNPISTAGGGQDGLSTRVWDLAYKGIIGTSGVLEARFGRTNRLWPHPTTPTDPIMVRYGKSSIPDANGNYIANSYMDLNDKGSAAKWTNGATSDRGDNFFDDTLVINYEHILSSGSSTHMIDVGMERQKFQWDTQTLAQMPPRNFYVPGQLATDYTLAETGGIDPATVNGKYIVVNWQALYSDVGGAGSKTLFDNGKRNLIPRVRVFTGNENGTYYQPSTSFYINDLWTLNQNHSIMAGLRSDTMKLQDDRGTLHSYSVITPRFEYKWDVFGDQSRVFNASYGQFHNRVPGGQFQQFVDRRLAYDSTYYWTGTAPTGNPNAPYLVDKSAILDLNNYKKLASYSGPGTFILDPNWKAPIATEYTVGLRRSYASGMSWRTTLVYKTWKNLYDSFPTYASSLLVSPTDPTISKSIYHRTTMNDPQAEKTYKGFELEWSIPFTQKLRFAGNYTYARTMTNAASVNDSPSADRTPYGNFRDFYDTLYPRDAYNPVKLQDPEHNAKAWFVYDLSRPKVKSSISFRVNYISGRPDYRSTPMQVGYPTGNWAPATPQALGLRNTLTLVQPGFTQEEVFTNSLKYDVELEVKRGAKVFVSIEVTNPFNVRMGGYSDGSWNGVPAYTDNTEVYGSPNYLTHGWRASSDLSNVAIGNARNTARAFTIEAGLRF